MGIYQATCYKEFVLNRIRSMPKNGRGEMQKMAAHLRVHPTLISQVLRGPRDLTVEQAFDLARYLGLNPVETEYFLTLVEIQRAGTLQLKEFLEDRRRRLGGVVLQP